MRQFSKQISTILIEGDWFMGQVTWFESGARDPRVNTMFQIANVDNAEIAWVEGDAVTHVIP